MAPSSGWKKRKSSKKTKSKSKHSDSIPPNSTAEGTRLSQPPISQNLRAQDVLPTTIKNGDIVIAVMGVTGSGKSTFINHLSEENVPIGHTLDSCTQELAEYTCRLTNGRRVVLVDTPGFDDQNRQDTDVLRDIAAWLVRTYRDSIQLSGIVYLHRIKDDRMTGAAMSNLRMFQKLCGKKGLANVVLATTFWSDITPQKGAEKESQLRARPDFWKNMIDQGSKVFRHDREAFSARDIVQYIIRNSNPTALDIQREMVEQKLTLDQTAAGREVQAEIQKVKAQYDEKIRRLEQDMMEAVRKKDEASQRQIQDQRQQMEVAIGQNNAALRRLRSDKNQLEAQVAEMRRDWRDQKRLREDRDYYRSKAEKLERASDKYSDVEVISEGRERYDRPAHYYRSRRNQYRCEDKEDSDSDSIWSRGSYTVRVVRAPSPPRYVRYN